MDPNARLDRAVRELREAAGPETLSGAARAAIVRRTLDARERPSRFAVLFPSTWRLALAGALPLALALAIVGLSDRDGRTARSADASPLVHKVGGQVVFEVAAGATITRSTVASDFRGKAAVRVEDGRYAERIGDGARLVFYKIE
jgi:hypothetical protein